MAIRFDDGPSTRHDPKFLLCPPCKRSSFVFRGIHTSFGLFNVDFLQANYRFFASSAQTSSRTRYVQKSRVSTRDCTRHGYRSQLLMRPTVRQSPGSARIRALRSTVLRRGPFRLSSMETSLPDLLDVVAQNQVSSGTQSSSLRFMPIKPRFLLPSTSGLGHGLRFQSQSRLVLKRTRMEDRFTTSNLSSTMFRKIDDRRSRTADCGESQRSTGAVFAQWS